MDNPVKISVEKCFGLAVSCGFWNMFIIWSSLNKGWSWACECLCWECQGRHQKSLQPLVSWTLWWYMKWGHINKESIWDLLKHSSNFQDISTDIHEAGFPWDWLNYSFISFYKRLPFSAIRIKMKPLDTPFINTWHEKKTTCYLVIWCFQDNILTKKPPFFANKRSSWHHLFQKWQSSRWADGMLLGKKYDGKNRRACLCTASSHTCFVSSKTV